jgi:hypothetical protein
MQVYDMEILLHYGMDKLIKKIIKINKLYFSTSLISY